MMKNHLSKWKKYEKEIHKELSSVFTDCDFQYDDKIFGKFSKTDRQIDISIRGNIGGNKILGIIDCKHFSKKIDVKIVESFLGMIRDVRANFGIIITNKGFSNAAKNRAFFSNLKLEILDFDHLEKIQLTYDDLINKTIKDLELSKYEFFKRCKQNWGYFDQKKSSYESKLIVFKEGFANTEYYAFKKIISVSSKIFRDFLDLKKVTIKIPSKRDLMSSNLVEEKRLYFCTIEREVLEQFLEVKFIDLRININLWGEFPNNKGYKKEDLLNFANEHIKSIKYFDYQHDI